MQKLHQQQQHQLVSPANLQHLTALSLQNIPAAVQFPGKIRPDRMSRMPIPRLVGIDYEELPPLAGAGRLVSRLRNLFILSPTKRTNKLERLSSLV
jgi:hypothetical protein